MQRPPVDNVFLLKPMDVHIDVTVVYYRSVVRVFLQSLQNQATEETFSSQRNNPQVVFCCFCGALLIAGATARNHQQVSNGYELLVFLLDGDSQMMSDGLTKIFGMSAGD